MAEWILIGALVATVLLWWDNARCGEQVLHHCRRRCEKAGVQLLDGSVARVRSWLRKEPGGGIQICRLYGFEYSDNFQDRRYGYVVMIGRQVVETSIPANRLSGH